jgi:hypothetical protein
MFAPCPQPLVMQWPKMVDSTSTIVTISAIAVIGICIVIFLLRNKLNLNVKMEIPKWFNFGIKADGIELRNSPISSPLQQIDKPKKGRKDTESLTVIEGLAPTDSAESDISDLGYVVLERQIRHEFHDRTSGLNVHEIAIRATRDNVSHYQGRYRPRDRSSGLEIPTGQRYSLNRMTDGFQLFTVELSQPLRKGQTEQIIMKLPFSETSQAKSPHSTFTNPAEHCKLHFTIILPPAETVSKAKGCISFLGHDHISIFECDLPVTGNMITWSPRKLKPALHYRVQWEWLNRS